MNKKLKKALYMFGFVLPIVAIPIITVACGTQTSQVEPTPTPNPAPAPEQQQPNKEPEIKEPEIKKIEEVKPNLDVLKNKEISEQILSKDISNLLDNWKDNDFKIDPIKNNKLYSKLVSSYINSDDENIKLKTTLRYSDLIKNISELNFVDLFNITSLSIENLKDDKLESIKLSEVFSDDMTKLVEAIKQKKEEEFAKEDTKYDDSSSSKGIKQKIEELFNNNPSSSFYKIKPDLENKDGSFDSAKLKAALKKFKFSDLINIEKLQEKLTFVNDSNK